MNVKRYVNISFVVAGLLTWVVLGTFYAWLLEWVAPSWDAPLIGVGFRVSNLLAFTTAVALAAWAWTTEGLYEQAIEIGNELSKVTWPKWEESRLATVVVVVTTIVVALLLGVFDLVWSKVTGWIYQIG